MSKSTTDLRSLNYMLDEGHLSNELSMVFKGVVLTTGEELLGKTSKKIRKPWILNNILCLMDRERAFKSLRNSSEEDDEKY